MAWRVGLGAVFALWGLGCGGADPAVAPESPPQARAPTEGPALIMVQAQFVREGGRAVPGPAKMVIWRTDGQRWYPETLEDPESNVFHKGLPWRDGILTVGAMKARLVHWTRDEGHWQPAVLWERAWGGRFDRLRDLAIADLTGDGRDEIVLATHDQGVVAVGTEGDDGWTFHEMDATPDTFVHEVEVGDVEGDGRLAFYVTPSGRNRASGESQAGGVVRYAFEEGAWARTEVVRWEETHAKEILVADIDDRGRDSLVAVREAHTVLDEQGELSVVTPVKLVRLEPDGAGGWSQEVLGRIPDRQARFLVAGDLTRDGRTDLVLAGMTSGLHLFRRQDDGAWVPTLIDDDSSGFEHATHLADLDGDGHLELYVAADDQRELRRYTWNGEAFDRVVIGAIPEGHITWNLQDGAL